MHTHLAPIKNLIDLFTRLPGIGPKSAERIVFYLLKKNNRLAAELVRNITALMAEAKICSQCFNITTDNPCQFCSDLKRDRRTVCVVAEPSDVQVIEKTGEYRGLYHILGGVLNPVEHITPDQLTIAALLERIKKSSPQITEVIIATNPDLEGESTALYLARVLKPMRLNVTRLARGLPMGATIEYADEVTISSALKGRQKI